MLRVCHHVRSMPLFASFQSQAVGTKLHGPKKLWYDLILRLVLSHTIFFSDHAISFLLPVIAIRLETTSPQIETGNGGNHINKWLEIRQVRVNIVNCTRIYIFLNTCIPIKKIRSAEKWYDRSGYPKHTAFILMPKHYYDCIKYFLLTIGRSLFIFQRIFAHLTVGGGPSLML